MGVPELLPRMNVPEAEAVFDGTNVAEGVALLVEAAAMEAEGVIVPVNVEVEEGVFGTQRKLVQVADASQTPQEPEQPSDPHSLPKQSAKQQSEVETDVKLTTKLPKG